MHWTLAGCSYKCLIHDSSAPPKTKKNSTIDSVTSFWENDVRRNAADNHQFGDNPERFSNPTRHVQTSFLLKKDQKFNRGWSLVKQWRNGGQVQRKRCHGHWHALFTRRPDPFNLLEALEILRAGAELRRHLLSWKVPQLLRFRRQLSKLRRPKPPKLAPSQNLTSGTYAEHLLIQLPEPHGSWTPDDWQCQISVSWKSVHGKQKNSELFEAKCLDHKHLFQSWRGWFFGHVITIAYVI